MWSLCLSCTPYYCVLKCFFKVLIGFGKPAWSSDLARYAKGREKDCPEFETDHRHNFSILLWFCIHSNLMNGKVHGS